MLFDLIRISGCTHEAATIKLCLKKTIWLMGSEPPDPFYIYKIVSWFNEINLKCIACWSPLQIGWIQWFLKIRRQFISTDIKAVIHSKWDVVRYGGLIVCHKFVFSFSVSFNLNSMENVLCAFFYFFQRSANDIFSVKSVRTKCQSINKTKKKRCTHLM